MAPRKKSRKIPASPQKGVHDRRAPATSDTKRQASQTSARSTVSGPSRKAAVAESPDRATAKMAGTEELASAFPNNRAKPSEFGKAAMEPAVGQMEEPRDPVVGASTLSETNASEKTGKGNPQVSFNPAGGPLDRVRVDSSGRALTTNQGVPHRGQPEFTEGRPSRAVAARGFHPSGKDHPLRPRTHSRAHRARTRLRGTRLL